MPEAPQESLDYELEVPLSRVQRLIASLKSVSSIVLVCGVLVVGAVVWQWNTLYTAVKAWRVDRLITKVHEATVAGDDGAVLVALRQAVMLQPGNVRTMRAVAEYHQARGEAAAVGVYDQLVMHEAATKEDYVQAAYAHLRWMRGAGLQPILESLEKRHLPGSEGHRALIEAMQLATQQKWQMALDSTRAALLGLGKDAPERGLAKLLHGQVLIQAGLMLDEDARLEEGMEALGQVVVEKTQLSQEAAKALLSLIGQAPGATILRGKTVMPWVEAAEQPMMPLSLQVAMWTLAMEASPESKEDVLHNFIKHYSKQAPALQLEAARWLLQKGEAKQVLTLFGSQAPGSMDLLLIRLDALAGLGEWRQVEELLKLHSMLLAPALKHMFLYRVETELGGKPVWLDVWARIERDIRGEKPDIHLYIAGYLARTGHGDEAATLYRRVLEGKAGLAAEAAQIKVSPQAQLAAVIGLQQTGAGRVPAADWLRYMEQLLEQVPDLVEAENDVVYLKLLTQAKDASLLDKAQTLMDRQPNLLSVRTTLALAELRQQRQHAAALIYKGQRIDWNGATDRARAVYAAVLRANGQSFAAEQIVAQIQAPQELFAEERALIGLE